METVKRTYLLCLLLFSFFFSLAGAAAAGEKQVGVIMTGKSHYYEAMHAAFTAALKGGAPGGNSFRFLLQRPFPDALALTNAARKLIAADVDLIVAYGAPAAQAVLNEKSAIPIVYAGVYDPASASLNRANISGCGFKIPVSSLLRHLKTIREIGTLSVIYSSLEDDSARQAKELDSLAEEQHIRLQKINIKNRMSPAEISSLKSSDGVFITGSSIASQWLADDILPAIQESGQPSVSLLPDDDESGIVVTLSQNPVIQGEKAATIAARVLAGERPENIPPQVLRETELVFNIRAAKQLGLKVPIELIADATRVIR